MSARIAAGQVERTQRAVRSLVVYRAVLDDEAGRAFVRLVDELAAGRTEAAFVAYHDVLASLLQVEPARTLRPVGNVWLDHVLDRIVADANAFSRCAERGGLRECSPVLRRAVAADLAALQRIANFDLAWVMGALSREGEEPVLDGTVDAAGVGDGAGIGTDGVVDELGQRHHAMKVALAEAADWSAMVGELAAHYATVGAGDMGRYRAFRWLRRGGAGRLEGVTRPDPIRLEDLIGYRSEREPVIRNTEQFVRGLPANNVLLYGDRGTGKSATVKAILNEYAPRGLRLVELPRPYLSDLPEVLALLRDRPQRFIVFVDDLSFEEQETDYKHLKALLEGSVEARPENVLVYATSNRRHLVRERFSDRNEAQDEVRREDTVQEKLSLADRFGLTVVFPSPDQARYLEIVEGLARQEGLQVPRDMLRQEALRWLLWHNDRSARTARQFIDDMLGRAGLGDGVISGAAGAR